MARWSDRIRLGFGAVLRRLEVEEFNPENVIPIRSGRRESRSMQFFFRRKLIVRSLAAIIALVVVLVVLTGLPQQHRWQVPRPNGFDSLHRAAGLLNGVPDREATNRYEVYVAENSEALKDWRESLGLGCELPLYLYERNSPNPMVIVQDVQQLAWAAEIQGRMFEEKRQHTDAADVYLGIVQTGIAIQRGPLISLLFGVAIEKAGLNGLERVRASLAEGERRRIRERLAEIGRERPAMEEIKVRESYYFRRRSGNPIQTLLASFYLRAPLKSAEGKLKRIEAENKMMQRSY